MAISQGSNESRYPQTAARMTREKHKWKTNAVAHTVTQTEGEGRKKWVKGKPNKSRHIEAENNTPN